MKPKHGALCIGIILAIIATILLIALPGSGNLYVAYGFCLVGIALMVAAVWIANIKNVPVSYAMIWQAAKFLPVSLIASIIVLVLQGMKVFAVPVVWNVILQIVLLAITNIKLLGIIGGADYINTVDDSIAAQRQWISEMQDFAVAFLMDSNACLEDQHGEIRRALKDLSDDLRYSDPISCPETADIEAKISNDMESIGELLAAGNAEQVIAKCTSIRENIRIRNTRLKIHK